jgi:hypothetical protein
MENVGRVSRDNALEGETSERLLKRLAFVPVERMPCRDLFAKQLGKLTQYQNRGHRVFVKIAFRSPSELYQLRVIAA